MRTIKKTRKLLPLLALVFFVILTAPVSVNASNDWCDNTQSQAALERCLEKSELVVLIQKIVNFLSAGVGVVVVGAIIVGGIQYIAAGNNASAVSAAKQRIYNALIALAAFILTFAFLQWLIPGGVFD